jgi:catechol 2,3-dioxygenase-like lactoylglutathione lyase family enzyme
MARIRYLALLSPAPDALARFYTGHCAMREISRTPDGDITLTDGGFNVTIFKLRDGLGEPRMEPGFHHLGIAVDSIDEVKARYLDKYPSGCVVEEAGEPARGAIRIHDPECNPVSLSECDFGLPPGSDSPSPEAAGPELADSASTNPRIAHIALNALDPGAVCDFYTGLFGFREIFAAHAHRMSDPTYRNRHVGDGYTNVAIQTFYSTSPGHEARFGIAHMGLLVADSAAFAAAVEGPATITRRPATRTQSEARMRDPEGNACDLSGRGWEVDTDKWRGAAEGD